MAKKLCFAGLLVLLVVACGQKKPLVRKEPPKPVQTQPSQTNDNPTESKEADQ